MTRKLTINHIPEEYLSDILVRMAYHSTSIEGNTISLSETVSIILENTILGDKKGTTLREFYEVENHRQTFEYIVESLRNGEVLTESVIKNIHSLLMDRLIYDKGEYKKTQNAILGSSVQLATPENTPFLMLQWIENVNYRLSISETIQEFAEVLAESHLQFESIHPFSDGNGRTGRMILVFLAMLKGIPPVVIKVDDRARYIAALSSENIRDLTELFVESIKIEQERLEIFYAQEKNNIPFLDIETN